MASSNYFRPHLHAHDSHVEDYANGDDDVSVNHEHDHDVSDCIIFSGNAHVFLKLSL